MIVTSQNIQLIANESAGIFNGLQTLRQLFPVDFETTINYKKETLKIQGCKIKDYPRFSWRGLLLYVSKHFFTVDEVKSYIDKMGYYKFNAFIGI